jgi:hypothetical protein
MAPTAGPRTPNNDLRFHLWQRRAGSRSHVLAREEAQWYQRHATTTHGLLLNKHYCLSVADMQDMIQAS